MALLVHSAHGFFFWRPAPGVALVVAPTKKTTHFIVVLVILACVNILNLRDSNNSDDHRLNRSGTSQ